MAPSLTIQEGPVDLEFLSKNNYNLQVAKAVSAPGGKPTFNVVYKSMSLAPNMTVSWSPTYGLNWATNIADPGAQVINNNDPNADAYSVNVGNNGYLEAVNIVVGILNQETQTWEAIFVSPDQLPPKGFGEYQPRDVVQLWYEEGILTETMMSKQSTMVETFDMTKIPREYFWYSTATGVWENSSTPFTFTP